MNLAHMKDIEYMPPSWGSKWLTSMIGSLPAKNQIKILTIRHDWHSWSRFDFAPD